MIEVSGASKPDGTTDVSKLNRTLDRQLSQCTTMVKRHLKQCVVRQKDYVNIGFQEK